MATKMTYGEQLKHPSWQRKRLEILERANFTCEACYDTESTLHVHHKRYVKGRMAWEYDAGELVALCGSCHDEAHEDQSMRAELLARLAPDGPLSADDFMAHGCGAAAHWLVDDMQLYMLIDHYRDQKPHQFWCGRVAQRFGQVFFDIGGMELLATRLFDSPEFVNELTALLARHGVGEPIHRG